MVAPGKSVKYPSEMTAVYTSALLSILSLALAIFLLKEKLWLLLYYFVSTVLVTATVFTAKHRILHRRATRIPNNILNTAGEEEDRGPGWRLLILAFVLLVSILAIPFLLTKVLNPSSWFILLISFTTGVSIAEILLYLYLS